MVLLLTFRRDALRARPPTRKVAPLSLSHPHGGTDTPLLAKQSGSTEFLGRAKKQDQPGGVSLLGQGADGAAHTELRGAKFSSKNGPRVLQSGSKALK